VPICNRFRARRVNSGKITTFYGSTPLCHRRWTGIFLPSGIKFRRKKLVLYAIIIVLSGLYFLIILTHALTR